MFRMVSSCFFLVMVAASLMLSSLSVDGFVVTHPQPASKATTTRRKLAFTTNNRVSSSELKMMTMIQDPTAASSLVLAADPIDPTTVVNGALGGLIDSPAILAVPIGGGLLVTAFIVWLNIAVAQPAVDDDEYEVDESAFEYDDNELE
eukprot:CAMPEP_0194033892 /NCGR_PEP_ID=MMETSP0009_2-20130614/6384_1 /TAXON_ID=210454 /ORGANISM="Grammatophora oceanica, Strain CCMP 410" /LENGTH=147 /DNA_ID=CAMNT_0038674623 /DNA_START=110 /DNA_END=553 /DNA_ORIENTATION=-